MFETTLQEKFTITTGVTTGWLHVVLVMYGFHDGEGFALYFDGSFEDDDSTIEPTGNSGGSVAHIIFGQNVDAQLDIDDVAFWLKELTPGEINLLYAQGMSKWLQVDDDLLCKWIKNKYILDCSEYYPVFSWTPANVDVSSSVSFSWGSLPIRCALTSWNKHLNMQSASPVETNIRKGWFACKMSLCPSDNESQWIITFSLKIPNFAKVFWKIPETGQICICKQYIFLAMTVNSQ